MTARPDPATATTATAAAPAAASGDALLDIRGLIKRFSLGGGSFTRAHRIVHAVAGVSFRLQRGETLALVGESGCGKTTLARTVALLQPPTEGAVLYDGVDLTRLSPARLKPYRRRLQIMFQDPFGSLDPRMRVGRAIREPLDIHRIGGRGQRRERVAALLAAVGLKPSDGARFPHEFSGGQRQRIALARALAPTPEVLIADEPVSALDVSVQSQVLNLMKDLKAEMNLSLLFISHDLAVVDFLADRVAVMYSGRIVEIGPREAVFETPAHPYTVALLRAVPVVDRSGGSARRRRRTGRGAGAGAGGGKVPVIGDVPSLLALPPGCAFHPRCPLAQDICREAVPALEPVAGDPPAGDPPAGGPRLAACHFSAEVRGQGAMP